MIDSSDLIRRQEREYIGEHLLEYRQYNTYCDEGLATSAAEWPVGDAGV